MKLAVSSPRRTSPGASTFRRRVSRAAVLLAGLLAGPAAAWVYPEHRNIAGSAIEGLDPVRKATLERLWTEARKGHEERLCASPWAGDQGKKPGCIDFAALPALAGDHSCSADEMLRTVLETTWVMDVAEVAAVLDKGLASAKNEHEARNRLTWSNLELERKDPEYSSRASSNVAHFLLTRETDDVTEFLRASLKQGADLNALGVWGRYHIAAIRLVHELEAGRVPAEKRPEVARAALAAEAYGDHFLEDTFAAGHVTGTWGDVATRLGTHDYYNEHGFDAVTWSGKPILMYGDANVKPADTARAAATIRAELRAGPRRRLARVGGGGRGRRDPSRVGEEPSRPTRPARRGRCPPRKGSRRGSSRRARRFSTRRRGPAASRPKGAMPRFRSEIGPFLGLASGISAGWAGGGFESTESPERVAGTMDIGARAGLGLEALLGEAGDGQVFLQAGAPAGDRAEGRLRGSVSRFRRRREPRAQDARPPGDHDAPQAPVLAHPGRSHPRGADPRVPRAEDVREHGDGRRERRPDPVRRRGSRRSSAASSSSSGARSAPPSSATPAARTSSSSRRPGPAAAR